MSEGAVNEAGASPFNPRAVLALVVLGSALFVALLWILASGMDSGSTNDGGGHAGGKGLNGYAALANLLEKRGYTVSRTRSESRLDDAGLLVLTPPLFGDADELNRIIEKRRRSGPTLLVLPKWVTMPATPALGQAKARQGWVQITRADQPAWGDALSAVGALNLNVDALRGESARWQGLGGEGRLAAPGSSQSMTSSSMVALVRDGNGRMLAGYLDDLATVPQVPSSSTGT